MRRLFQFLFDNPILLFIVVAWVAGAIGNILKASKKARGASGGAPPVSPPPRRAPVQPGRRSPEDIAAEMRRILGLDPDAPPRSPKPQRAEAPRTSAPRTTGQSEPVRRAPLASQVAKAAPPPLPSQAPLSPNERRLDIHVDPHVGEGIQHRHLGKPRQGLRETQTQLGGLGRRTSEPRPRRSAATRYPLTDLKRIMVLNEILGPPLALRRDDERLR